MFKECIEGLEKLIEKDITPGSIVLVTGAPGTLNSCFVHNLLSNYLSGRDEFGLYASLEEPKESHLQNISSIGIQKPDNLQIFDYLDIRTEWKGEGAALNMMKITEDIIKFYTEKEGDKFTVFALDSLNALHSLARSTNLRKDSYFLFTSLRESDFTSFITLELDGTRLYQPDYFLADGVIEVGILETPKNVGRYIQIRKMRATGHIMKKHQLIVEKGGLVVSGPTYE